MTAALLWTRHVAPGVRFRVARAWPWVVLVVALLGLVAGPAGPAGAQAPASRFIWNEVAVTLRLQEDGTARVREHDTVQFVGGPFRQGFREIPLAALDNITQVTVTEVGDGPARPYEYESPGRYSRNAPNTYTFQRVGTTMRIEWSFPPTTSAARSWVLEYTVRGVVRVYDDAVPPYQQVWWIGVGSELSRDAPVDLATLAIILPRPVDLAEVVAESNGTPYGGEDGQVWVWRKESLGTGETLEASLRFPPFLAVRKPSWQETYDRQMSRGAPANLAFLGLALLTAVGGSVGLLAAWWTRGRDPEPGLVPERLTEPPDDTPPGVVGALLDEQVDHRDFVATLIDLGRRGVVRITDQVQPEVSPRLHTAITLLQPDAPMAPYERTLLFGLFGKTWWRDAQVRLPLEEPGGMREALRGVEEQLYAELLRRGYFATRPPSTRAGWRFAGIGLWVLAAIILLVGMAAGVTLIWPLVASIALAALGAAVFVVSQHMPRKTRAGAEAAARWRAYRNGMEAISRVDAQRGGQERFERALPYAVAFGLERPWIDTFTRAAPASMPAWYDMVNLDGQRRSRTWRPDGGFPLPSASLPLPDADLPHLGGLQEMSALTSSSLQASSNTLYSLFNEIGYAFTPQSIPASARPSLSNTNSSDLALRIGVQILFALLSGGKGGRGSGGGGGGFS